MRPEGGIQSCTAAAGFAASMQVAVARKGYTIPTRLRGRFSSGRVLAIVSGAAVTLGLVACNALTGVSDLGTCADCLLPRAVDGGGDGTVMVNEPADGAADALPSSCSGNEARCEGLVSAQCTNGDWVKTTCPKTSDTTTGMCADYPSCRNAAGTSCGLAGNVTSCCDTAAVPGGTFNRRNVMSTPATVSPFTLDKYEVTVGRMRAFIDAGGVTKLAPPATGAGAHPKIPGSGWNPVWNVFLPADVAALCTMLVKSTPTWTDQPGANEHRPINNVSWFVANAFCARDGGRLPTYAEMNLASAGGSEQRVYPWSVPAGDQTIARTRAAYTCAFTLPALDCPPSYCSDAAIISSPCDPNVCLAPASCVSPSCTGCTPADIAPVGSLPTGTGKWGHFDLSGNVAELIYDTDGILPTPCNDCVHAPPSSLSGPVGGGKPRLDANFIVAGGGWDYSATSLFSGAYTTVRDDFVDNDVGFRCAR